MRWSLFECRDCPSFQGCSQGPCPPFQARCPPRPPVQDLSFPVTLARKRNLSGPIHTGLHVSNSLWGAPERYNLTDRRSKCKSVIGPFTPVLLTWKSVSFWQGFPRKAVRRRDGPAGRLYKIARLREMPILIVAGLLRATNPEILRSLERILLRGFLCALRVLAVNAGQHFHRQDAKDAKKTLRTQLCNHRMLFFIALRVSTPRHSVDRYNSRISPNCFPRW